MCVLTPLAARVYAIHTGDGEVSRKEFHKAMPALGLEDLSAKDIDELFNSWDADGGGSLDFKELSAILKTPGAAASKLRAAAKVAEFANKARPN